MKRERPTLSHARNERDNPLTHPLYQPLHERKRHNSRLPYSTIVTWDLHLFDHHHHRSFRQRAHKAITLSAQPPPPPLLVACCRLSQIPALPPRLAFSFDSPSPRGFWSPSRPSTLWCPLQCRKAVVHTLSVTSQLISLISAI